MRYELVTTEKGLAGLTAEWTEVWGRDARATPFQRAEWLLPWWRQFGTDALRTVVLRKESGAMAGLLPLYVYREPATGERKLMALGVGTTDYLDGVWGPGCGAAEVCGALRWLTAQGEDWDVLSVVQMREGSGLLEALRGMGAGVFATEPCRVTEAVAMAELPAKLRRNAMYYRNVAARGGAVRLRLADAGSCGEDFELLVRLHTERWEGRGEAGVLADPKVLLWHREAVPAMARAGLLRLAVLEVAGEAVSSMYGLVDAAGVADRTAYLYLPGISVRHSGLRPGTVLLAMLGEALRAEGVRHMDLLRGGEAYKQHWRARALATWGATLPYAAVLGERGA